MSDRAHRYAARQQQEKKKRAGSILVAYVSRTPKGKIRLRRIGIRIEGHKEETVCELPKEDPRYVFESDYKVRKAMHDEVRRSSKFSRYYDSTARVFYGE